MHKYPMLYARASSHLLTAFSIFDGITESQLVDIASQLIRLSLRQRCFIDAACLFLKTPWPSRSLEDMKLSTNPLLARCCETACTRSTCPDCRRDNIEAFF